MPATAQALDVVVWRSGGDAMATPDSLRGVEIRLDRDGALPKFLEEITERAGAPVALLRSDESVAHVELLEPDAGATFDWRAADTEIGGQNPWNRPGWFRETSELIAAQLQSAAGATLTGPVVQVKHWSISALVRIETDGGVFWFKQVPPFMAHEGPLIRWLAELRPGTVPEVVALGPDWMLTREFARSAEDAADGNAYGLLAELQLDTAPLTSELLALGCPDRRPEVLKSELTSLCERGDLLDESYRERLAAAMPAISDRIDQLGALPATLVHGDLHAGNWTRTSGSRWLIFDWTDACVAHPLMDLGVLPHDDDDAARAASLDAYKRVWSRTVDEAELDRAIEVSRPVAAAYHAVSYERILDGVAAEDAYAWRRVPRWYLDRMFELLGG